MIEYIKGELTEWTPTMVVLETAGIGYAVHISLTTYSELSGKQTARLYISEIIREDAHTLYGFSTKKERELFLVLNSVSGVGPNTARMILSSFPPTDLIQVILGNDEKALTSVKGIGLKTAQRILLELKNKVQNIGGEESTTLAAIGAANASATALGEEAVEALLMLGFAKPASQKAVSSILKKDPSATIEQVIKGSLKIL